MDKKILKKVKERITDNEIMAEVCIGLAEVTERFAKLSDSEFQKNRFLGQAKTFRAFAKLYKTGGVLNRIKKSN